MISPHRTRWTLLLIAVVLTAVALAACGGSTPAPTVTVTTTPTGSSPSATASPIVSSSPTATPAATMTVSLYFMRGEFVGTAHRSVPQTTAVATAAMTALLGGPLASEKAAGLKTIIPTGTKLRGVTISNGVATVDLSSAYESGGGTLSMTARLAQVVYTLTQFPTVKGVNFKIDGKKVTVFGGEGIMLTHPQTRADYESVTPAIFVESPAVGDSVRSPITFRGTANVFEAQFQVQLFDAKGNVLVEKAVHASSGTGTRGTFKTPLSFTTKATTGRLKTYDLSAKDGTAENIVTIPLAFAH
jgi:germination protein M